MKVLTAAQMQAVDRRTIEECGIPGLLLMENAGNGLFEVLSEYFEEPADLNLVVLCGPGNNGGDGMVLARRLLQAGGDPTVVLIGNADKVAGDAATNLEALRGWNHPVTEVTGDEKWQAVAAILDDAEVVVDALLGTGLNKPLSGLLARVVEDLNDSPAFVLAVDLPTGMNSDSVEPPELSVWADATVTFTAPKIAHLLNRDIEAFGELHVVPIGTPPALLDSVSFSLESLDPAEVAAWMPIRRAASHKGSYGHVAIIAGSRGQGGAAALAGQSALRSGSGLVTVMTPPSVQAVVASFRPELMTDAFPVEGEAPAAEAADWIIAQLSGRSAAAVGPGMGTADAVQQLIREVVRRRPCPLVLDADGLNAFAGHTDELRSAAGPPLVLTPHPGEFGRLVDRSVQEVLRDQLTLTVEFAARHSVWVVLKTFRTLITDPEGRQWVSPTGNSGMATAGTGDCLTGVLASQLGQDPDLSDPDRVIRAVARAVFLHGLAGDLAAELQGEPGLTAGDLISSVPAALRALEAGE